mgnify:CR=1 FL=1
MAAKEIVFSPNAEAELGTLTRQQQKKIFRELRNWSSGESKPEIEKIKSQPSFYRLKIADVRIVYYPFENGRVVLLLIRDRKNAYRNLPNLPQKLQTAARHLGI